MNLFFIAMLVCCPINQCSGWLVDLKGSRHLAGDPDLFTHLENNPAPTETESKGRVRASRGQVKIPCRTKNGVADLTLENVVYLPHFYPSVVSVSQLESAGYSWKRTLKGITFSNKEDTTLTTASMHPAGIYFIGTAPHNNNQNSPPSWPFQKSLLLASTILFTLALHSAPFYSQSPPDHRSHLFFIPLILTIRLLIFLPFLLFSYTTTPTPTSSAFLGSRPSPAQQAYLVLGISYLFEASRLASFVRGEESFSMWVVMKSINLDPAVSALGYDLVLAWVSVLVWGVEEEEGGTRRGVRDAGVRGMLWGVAGC